MTIEEMLARNGRMYPDRVALIERVPSKALRRQLTWKEFDERVNRIARGLIARGVGKGDRVVHWMHNSISWLEAYFGIVRTGAIVVPLNFRFNERDYLYCLEATEPALAIVDGAFVGRVEAAGFDRLTRERYIVNGDDAPEGMETLERMVGSAPVNPVKPEIRMSDPCGLYFTSGTTGDPKPILLTHYNMEHGAVIEVAHGLRRPGDVFAVLKPLYHTGDFIHWLSSLALGGTAVIQKDKITPQAIFSAIQEERCTVVMLLVPWIQDILSEIETGRLNKGDYDLSSWRLLLLGAQPVPPTLITTFYGLFPGICWEVLYGLTEATGPGCIHLSFEDRHKIGSIGRPGFNWEARVVNSNDEDAPRGSVGEIVMRGNGVMKGYYKNPAKTAETIKDGWLYSGDMARIDDEGFFWIVDRKKDVIISGGENVYPAEVEEVIQAHPKVRDVGVIGLHDDRLGEIVAAVVELKPGITDIDGAEKELHAFCEASLPRYKRPRRIIIGNVPRNPTGKIEKFRLREVYSGNG